MSTRSSDRTAHQDRLRLITRGRLLAAAALALVLWTVARGLLDDGSLDVLLVTGLLHLVVQLAVTGAARTGRFLGLAGEAGTVADVAALAVLITLTGGTASPLSILLLPEVVAVTLLFGRGAGVRVAVLASLAVVWLVPSGPPAITLAVDAVRDADRSLAVTLDPTARAAVLLAVVWGTALVTGWLADAVERDLRRRTEDLAILREVTPYLDPRQGPDRSAQALADVLVSRLGYPASAVWLPDGDGLRLAAEAGGRRHPSIARTDRSLDLGEPLVEAALSDGSVVPVRRDDPRSATLAELFGARAPLGLAGLRLDDRVVGLLAVEAASRFCRRPVLRVRQVRLLRMLVEQAALLLDNARLQAELADLAVTDAVTGLPNHRFLQQRLGEELERVGRSTPEAPRALSVALLDLDHFKKVNDTYGHPTGDRVLADVATAAARTLRGSDVLCRYGGEEFAAILPEADADAARRASERVRAAVSELRFTSVDGREFGPVTVSIGLTTVIGEAADRSAVLARADGALYEAKRAGRDRVVHDADHTIVLS
jgi:diguanylate cyclase (GGDEF)-like protein